MTKALTMLSQPVNSLEVKLANLIRDMSKSILTAKTMQRN
jgi:hypothetical protein